MVTINSDGEIWVNSGVVIDVSGATSTYYTVGSGIADDAYSPTMAIRIGKSYKQLFVGGNGTSMETTGSITGTLAPIGYFRQTARYEWQDKYGNTITFDPATGDADLSDSNDVIATFSNPSATIAPVGTFTATVYGEDTYNGGSSFTLSGSYEGGGNTIPDLNIRTEFTSQITNEYIKSATWGEWESEYVELDSATFAPFGKFKLTVANDGQITISDSVDDIASGTGPSKIDPTTSTLTATSYGSENYFGGSFPVIYVYRSFIIPIAGYVWVELELSSGSLVGATGPFFGASLPANSSTLEVVPVAYSDGNGNLEQIHEGPIFWR